MCKNCVNDGTLKSISAVFFEVLTAVNILTLLTKIAVNNSSIQEQLQLLIILSLSASKIFWFQL